MDGEPTSRTHLTWANVGLGFAFVVFDAAISHGFGLGVGLPLVTAAVRCIIQLGIMALVLQKIFEAENPWGVAGLACELWICQLHHGDSRIESLDSFAQSSRDNRSR